MPIWVWVIIIAAALAVFIPIKVKMTRKFLNAQKKKDAEEEIDG